MPWHPPIPSGRLYSEPALALGPGVALLLWCYDNIRRDGSIEINLQQVAQDIGRPYGTIRDWWAKLRAGDFFVSATDRGKRGWVVQLADEWIDWRVMRHNYPEPPAPSTQNERRNTSVEEPQPDVEGSVNAASTQNERRNISVDHNVYKEDHHDQESGGDTARKRADPPGKQASYQELFEAIATTCQIDLQLCSQAQRKAITQTAKRLAETGKKAEEILAFAAWWAKFDWRGRKGEPPQPSHIQDLWAQWQKQEKKHAAATKHRHARSGTEWAGCTPAPLDQPF